MTLINVKKECHVKKDTEVKRFMQARHKGATQQVAAARAGMSERTARRYERAGKLPSELKRPHTWRTRPNPFEEDWPWVVQELQRDPARPRDDVVCAAVRATSPAVSADPGAHLAAPHRAVESAAWA